jgi:tRNA-dihydrouridine synthase B
LKEFDPASEFKIGDVVIRNRIVLAPMSGVTDLPFRQLAWRFGAGLVVTEMVAAKELVCQANESWARLKGADLSPHMVQLAGREAHWMAEAAKIAEANGADLIDINMGCPAKKVTGGYSGSALMRDPDHALCLIEATVKAVKVPVSVKMRLGWDEMSINAPDIARRAEAAGVQMITVHGRTRMQFYEGKANWDAIRRVRDAISVPLIANGDVETADDVRHIVETSGADAVMIGRGALGQPWLPGVLAGVVCPPDRAQILQILIGHYEEMVAFYGAAVAVRHARKHLGWYVERCFGGGQKQHLSALMTEQDPERVITRLRILFSEALEVSDRTDEAA